MEFDGWIGRWLTARIAYAIQINDQHLAAVCTVKRLSSKYDFVARPQFSALALLANAMITADDEGQIADNVVDWHEFAAGFFP
jgi:hypothetical protein